MKQLENGSSYRKRAQERPLHPGGTRDPRAFPLWIRNELVWFRVARFILSTTPGGQRFRGNRAEIGHFGSPPRLRRGGRLRSLRRGGATGLCGILQSSASCHKLACSTRNARLRLFRSSLRPPRVAVQPLSLRGTSPPDLRRGALKASNLQSGFAETARGLS